MSLVVLENVSIALGGRTLFEDLGLRIAEQDRIGLIGPNGSGKTTLMRLIAGEQAPDVGTVRRRRDLRIGYLPQEMAVEGGRSILELVRSSVRGRAELEERLSAAETELANAERDGSPDDEAHRERLTDIAEAIADLHERIGHFETHYSEHQAKRILAGLGFASDEHDRDVGELSGGWKMRAVLASLLFMRPDLLLLDEPTNHLDMPSVAWLSGFLQRYERAFILISHDREFLNEQIRRVVSFEAEGVRTYAGNYDQYLRQRAEEEEVLEARAKNVEKKRDELQRFVDRFRAKASKASQAQSKLKQLEKLETIETPRRVSRRLVFKFPPIATPGREVLRADGLRKAYGDHVVLDGVDLRVERGERIGIIGVNGAGKTTLLRVLAGELPHDGGATSYGHNVKPSYYAQHHVEVLRPDQTVYDSVAERDRDRNITRIRAVLGALGMGDGDVEKKIAVLSGGERARVALARMLIDPGNVLLMDEPTNHLDLQSAESLCDALVDYEGTIVFVSHNRSFLRRLATRIWHVADGHVTTYPGTLDEYMSSSQRRLDEEDHHAASALAAVAAATRTASSAAQSNGDGKPRGTRDQEKERKRREAERRAERTKKLGPLEKEIAALEKQIADIEAAQRTRTEELGDPAVYQDAVRRDTLLAEFQKAKDALEERTWRWMELQEQLEKLRAELKV